jgi:hypothetical protein
LFMLSLSMKLIMQSVVKLRVVMARVVAPLIVTHSPVFDIKG